MKTMKLLFYLSAPSTKHLVRMDSLQQRCLLHTCLPLMNKEKSANGGEGLEQPHMRIEARAAAAEIRIYNLFERY